MAWFGSFFTLLVLQSGPPAPEIPSPELQTRVRGLPDWVTTAEFAPDGSQLVFAGYDFLSFADTATWDRQPIAQSLGAAGSLRFSRDGHTVALGGYQVIRLFNRREDGTFEPDPVRVLKGHRGQVTDLTFADNGNLVSASTDETVRIWNTASGQCERILRFDAPVQALDVLGRKFVVGLGDIDRPTRAGSVRLGMLENGKTIHEWNHHTSAVLAVRFVGKLIVSGGYDEVSHVFDPDTGKQIASFEKHSRPINKLVPLPDGLVASVTGGRAAGKNELAVWETTTGKQTFRSEVHESPITAVCATEDGRWLATGSHDKSLAVLAFSQAPPAMEAKADIIRIGMIGLDTSHCTAFTKVLNDEKAADDVAGCKVIIAYPQGSKDIESSASRIPRYTQDMKNLKVEIAGSIQELLPKVDAILLETNDGRLHLEQFLECAKAGKPTFIDKPVAAQLDDVIAIYEIARRYKVPMFSSSSLRFSTGLQQAIDGRIGRVLGCEAFSPCSLEKTHSDLFWYGIHGVEILYTAMGAGCESVSRSSTKGFEVVTGTWSDGRLGTFRGIRSGKTGYGGRAYGEKAIQDLGGYSGYRPLVVEIVRFFKTGKSPVPAADTIELYAFMAAAEQSKQREGASVSLSEVMEKATASAMKKLKALGVPEKP